MVNSLDLAVLEWFRSVQQPLMSRILYGVSLLATGGGIWVLLALVLLARKSTRRVGLAMALALILDLILCNGLIKSLIRRPRPWIYLPELLEEIVIPLPWQSSFPSGHTAASFAGAGALAFSRWRWAPWALALAALIGVSRLYLCVHFFTDVVFGALLGLLCGWLGTWISRRIPDRWMRL